MKLRNKKTGENGEYKVISAGYLIRVKDCNSDEAWQYDCLAGFNEDWEDYKPVDPLIEDEKIRKFVRDWATFNKIKKAIIKKIVSENNGFENRWFKITGYDTRSCVWGIEIHAEYSETVSKDYKGDMITITELCGEEG